MANKNHKLGHNTNERMKLDFQQLKLKTQLQRCNIREKLVVTSRQSTFLTKACIEVELGEDMTEIGRQHYGKKDF